MTASVLCAGTYVVDIITGILGGPVVPASGCTTAISFNPGGNALNVAVDLANLTGANTPILCAGSIGNDFEGRFLRDYLEKNGITDRTKTAEKRHTAKSIILSFGNETRAFVVDKGASAEFRQGDLLDLLEEIKPSVFYIGESLASPDIDKNLPAILQCAKRSGAITIVDYIIYDGIERERLFASAPFTDFLHLNDYEARIITGKKTIIDAAGYMKSKGFPMTAVSEGEKGFVLYWKDRLVQFPAFKVTCADATGAGDAFCSGMLYGILKTGGIPPDDDRIVEIALFASACGACAVTETGCTNGVSLPKVQDLVAKHGAAIKEQLCTVIPGMV